MTSLRTNTAPSERVTRHIDRDIFPLTAFMLERADARSRDARRGDVTTTARRHASRVVKTCLRGRVATRARGGRALERVRE